MKKLFLSSSFSEVSDELLLLEKDVYGKRVTFIPTASNVEKIKSYDDGLAVLSGEDYLKLVKKRGNLEFYSIN